MGLSLHPVRRLGMGGRNLVQSIWVYKQQANAGAWNGVCSVFLKTATESSALPSSQCCIKCSDAAQHLWIECGPVSYSCHVHVLVKFILVPTSPCCRNMGGNNSSTVIGLQVYLYHNTFLLYTK